MYFSIHFVYCITNAKLVATPIIYCVIILAINRDINMNITPDIITGNTITSVAELYQNDPAALEALVTLSRMLGIELDSQSLLFLGDHIQDRVWALQTEDDIGDEDSDEIDDDGIFESFLDDGGEEEDFVVFHFNDDSGTEECDDECCGCHDETGTTNINIMFDDFVTPDAFDYGMTEDADGTIVLTETLTQKVIIDEIDVLSKKGKENVRFIIVDAENGELIDDNDGKGYKSRSKAENVLWSTWIGES